MSSCDSDEDAAVPRRHVGSTEMSSIHLGGASDAEEGAPGSVSGAAATGGGSTTLAPSSPGMPNYSAADLADLVRFRALDDHRQPWRRRVAFLKKNIPSIISLVSVVLNVVIVGLLIPNMKNEIAVMQGQSNSVQSQVNTMHTSLLTINDKINGVDNRIVDFNRNLDAISNTFNSTQSNIQRFADTTFNRLTNLNSSSLAILDSFQQRSVTFQANLDFSLSTASAHAALLDSTIASSQSAAQAVSYAAIAQFNNASGQLQTQLNASTQLLQRISTSVETVQAIRDEFVTVLVPSALADLRSLNASLHLRVDALEADLSAMRTGIATLSSRATAIETLTGPSSLVHLVQSTSVALSPLIVNVSLSASRIAQQQTSLATINGQVAALQSGQSAINGQVTALQNGATSTNNVVTALQSTAASTTTAVLALQSASSTTNSQVAVLQSLSGTTPLVTAVTALIASNSSTSSRLSQLQSFASFFAPASTSFMPTVRVSGA
jgi:predicted  nucleic acid-binding Zn-ribbon protein